MRPRRILAVFWVAALAAGACGGDDDGAGVRDIGSDSGSASGSASGSGVAACEPFGDPSSATASIGAILDEWVIDLEDNEIAAGVTTIVAENRGEEPHEIVVVKGVSPSGLPLDADGAADEAKLPSGALLGEIEAFPSGDTCDGTFELTAGEYTLFCNIVEEEADGKIESHLAEGMVTTLTVR